MRSANLSASFRLRLYKALLGLIQASGLAGGFDFSYSELAWDVVDDYAFSCFHNNVGLRDLPAIRHIESADAVVVDHHPPIANTVLLFGVLHINVVDQFSHHAPCVYGYISIAADSFQKIIHISFAMRRHSK